MRPHPPTGWDRVIAPLIMHSEVTRFPLYLQQQQKNCARGTTTLFILLDTGWKGKEEEDEVVHPLAKCFKYFVIWFIIPALWYRNLPAISYHMSSYSACPSICRTFRGRYRSSSPRLSIHHKYYSVCVICTHSLSRFEAFGRKYKQGLANEKNQWHCCQIDNWWTQFQRKP